MAIILGCMVYGEVRGVADWSLRGVTPRWKSLETFLAGALYREFREVMRILTTFFGKTHRNPS